MAGDTRDRMVAAATQLFAERGYDATGFRDIVDQSGAARGAIYHHFPEGKAELGERVALRAGGRLLEAVRASCATGTPGQALKALFELVTGTLPAGTPSADHAVTCASVASSPVAEPARPGCPVAAVALAADDPDGRLRAAANLIFADLRAALTDCLVRDGVAPGAAGPAAALAVAAAEGSVILCRAASGREPIDQVRRALTAGFAGLPRSAGISSGQAGGTNPDEGSDPM